VGAAKHGTVAAQIAKNEITAQVSSFLALSAMSVFPLL
jgi:hypothetical protein